MLLQYKQKLTAKDSKRNRSKINMWSVPALIDWIFFPVIVLYCLLFVINKPTDHNLLTLDPVKQQ